MDGKKRVRKTIKIMMMIAIILSFVRFLDYKIMIDTIYIDKEQLGKKVLDYRFYYYAFDNVWEQKNLDKLHDCTFLQEQLSGGNGKNYFKETYPFGCYLYPAHFAVAFAWLAYFPYLVSQTIWTIGLSVLLLIGVYLISKIMFMENKEVKKKERVIFLFVMMIVALGIAPTTIDTFWVNSNRLIFFLISLSFYLHYYKKKSLWAGIFLGLATVFKITPAILIVFYLFKKQWKILYGAIISGVVTTLISIKFVGFETIYNFITHDFWFYSKGLSAHYMPPVNSSIKAITTKYLTGVSPSIIFVLYGLLLLGIYIYILIKNENKEKELILLSLSPLLFTPHLETNHMILSLFGIYLIWKRIYDKYETINSKFNIVFMMVAIATILLFLHPVGVEYFIVCILLLIATLIEYKSENKKNVE